MHTDTIVSLVVAVAENGVIGNHGNLPWHLPDDLRRFKMLTTGQTVIVGRKTHESIVERLGHPLPERRTIIVTHANDYGANECTVVRSPEAGLEIASTQEVFIIGGAEIYSAFLPRTRKIYRTLVHASLPGDAFFPEEFDPKEWKIFHLDTHPQDGKHSYPFSYELLVRKRIPTS